LPLDSCPMLAPAGDMCAAQAGGARVREWIAAAFCGRLRRSSRGVRSVRTFPVAPHSSRSATFTVCTSGFTQPAGVCYSVYEGGVEYWGDPNPDMASIDAVTPGTGSLCIP